MKLGWKMEILFSGILLFAHFSGVIFEEIFQGKMMFLKLKISH